MKKRKKVIKLSCAALRHRSCSGDSCGALSYELRANDTWAPLVLLTGEGAAHGTLSNFIDTVCGTALDVDPRHQGGQ